MLCQAGLRAVLVRPGDARHDAHRLEVRFEESARLVVVGCAEAARTVATSSTKSMTGHLLGAAGAIEAIAAIMAVVHDTIPPTINQETPDPECDLNYTPNCAARRTVRYALSNTFGFGGHNATLLFRKYTE